MRATRILPNLSVPDVEEAKDFYLHYLGLAAEEFNLGWVARYTAPGTKVSVQLVSGDSTAPEDSVLSVATADVYWLTGTIGSSMRMYAANGAIPLAQHGRRVQVPSGFSLFPADLVRPPRTWLDRVANVVRMTEPPRGGHFAPFEEPELYAHELLEFFRPYRG